MKKDDFRVMRKMAVKLIKLAKQREIDAWVTANSRCYYEAVYETRDLQWLLQRIERIHRELFVIPNEIAQMELNTPKIIKP